MKDVIAKGPPVVVSRSCLKQRGAGRRSTEIAATPWALRMECRAKASTKQSSAGCLEIGAKKKGSEEEATKVIQKKISGVLTQNQEPELS